MKRASAVSGSRLICGAPGNEREAHAGRGQHRRIGNREAARHLQQQDRDGEEQEQALEEAQGMGLRTGDAG